MLPPGIRLETNGLEPGRKRLGGPHLPRTQGRWCGWNSERGMGYSGHGSCVCVHVRGADRDTGEREREREREPG
jgi:hypothetical protein